MSVEQRKNMSPRQESNPSPIGRVLQDHLTEFICQSQTKQFSYELTQHKN